MICGIDPGLHGGVALLGHTVYLYPMPISRHPKGRGWAFDLKGMDDTLKHLPSHVFIEKAQTFPGQGAVSAATTARGMALWEGMLFAVGVPYTIVPPKEWQKVMLAGMPKGDTKAASILRAQQLFPSANLRPGKCRKDQDGMSDALLIAEYGRRQLCQTIAGGRAPDRKPGHHRSPMAAK